MNKRYAVTQTMYIWAEDGQQAARLVRQLQRDSAAEINDLRYFDVHETRDNGRGLRNVRGTHETVVLETP